MILWFYNPLVMAAKDYRDVFLETGSICCTTGYIFCVNKCQILKVKQNIEKLRAFALYLFSSSFPITAAYNSLSYKALLIHAILQERRWQRSL